MQRFKRREQIERNWRQGKFKQSRPFLGFEVSQLLPIGERLIAYSSMSAWLRLFDTTSNAVVQTATAGHFAAWSLATSGNLLFSGTGDGKVKSGLLPELTFQREY